jgi:adenylosuccinate lyase
MDKIYIPQVNALLNTIKTMAIKWMDEPMLARTHGQPATPTRVGKELMVFVERLENQVRRGFNLCRE